MVQQLRGTIRVNGRPLRGAYVEHLVFGFGTGMYMTDNEGRVRIDTDSDEADIRIICQNPVARVLNGDAANIGVYQDRKIDDGDVVDLHLDSHQDDFYAILNRLKIAYEVAFRPLPYFQDLPDPDFPLGRAADLRSTRDQDKRIDVVYPDHSVSPRAWTEPRRLLDNYPLIHLPHRSTKPGNRIFGDSGAQPVLVPAELAHALHFIALTTPQRQMVQGKYLQYILGDLVSGGDGSHGLDKPTTPEVAFIEAVDWYGKTFHDFLRQRQGGTSTLVIPEPITSALQTEYIDSMWTSLTRSVVSSPPIPDSILNLVGKLERFPLPPGVDRLAELATRERRFRRPIVTGDDVEGAVFGAIFVDFAREVGLGLAASIYFEANALNFGQYWTFVDAEYPQHADALEDARIFWKL
jgi:hypothetical protein